MQVGLAAGAVALVVTWFLLIPVAALPLRMLILTLLLAWGLVSWAAWLHHHGMRLNGGALVAASTALALALVVARLLPKSGLILPLWMHTLAWPVLMVAMGLGGFALAVRFVPRHATAAATAPFLAALAGVIAAYGGWVRIEAGVVLLLGIAMAGAALLTLLQYGIASRLTWPHAAGLATPAGVLLALSQLIDGLVTYLAVNNPLGLAPDGIVEQMALSAWILEVAGPMYPLVKWMLGAAVAIALHTSNWDAKRFGLFLLILYAGLMPGIFSASNLL